MGGIREKGFFLNCDRCSKDKEIIDEAQIVHYKKFRDRKDRTNMMFMSMLLMPDGEKMASFEWLCPECISAVGTYLAKAAPDKDAETPAPRKRKAKDAAPAPEPEATAPDRDATPPPEAEKADDDDEDKSEAPSDNELFD